MSLLTLILILVVVGVVMYLINLYVPMDGTIKRIMNIVVIIILLIWLLQVIIGPFPDIRIGR